MSRNLCMVVALAGMTLGVASAAQAESMSLGQFEYQNSCAACHGASGKGDGPVSEFLSGAEIPDLTMVQKNNGGVFPVQRLYDVIEGSAEASVSIHGNRDMPVWGSRYMAQTQDGSNMDPFSPDDSRRYVRARILSLIEYISTLQAM